MLKPKTARMLTSHYAMLRVCIIAVLAWRYGAGQMASLSSGCCCCEGASSESTGRPRYGRDLEPFARCTVV